MKITNKRLQTWMHVHGFTEDTLPTSDNSDNPVITINGERACWTWHYSYWIQEQSRTFTQEGYAPFKSEFEAQMTFLDKGGNEAFDKWLAERFSAPTTTPKGGGHDS